MIWLALAFWAAVCVIFWNMDPENRGHPLVVALWPVMVPVGMACVFLLLLYQFLLHLVRGAPASESRRRLNQVSHHNPLADPMRREPWPEDLMRRYSEQMAIHAARAAGLEPPKFNPE